MMTRSKLKDNTCLICEFESKNVRNALENEEWITAMNGEIEQIQKKQDLNKMVMIIDKFHSTLH